jgi:RNA polymerase sporulation-specific sigma factor
MIIYKVQSYSEIGFEHSDYIQEGLLGLYYAVKSYKPDSNASFKTFAYVCIGNKLNSVHKSIGRQKNIPINSAVSIEDSEKSLPNRKNNPEDLVIIDEEISEIKRKIDFVLSENERNVLFLYLEGLSYKQISEKLNIKPKSVDNTIQQIRKKLRP